METLRFLIPYFLKIAFSFFFVALVWWLVTVLFPGLSVKAMFLRGINQTGTSTLSEILPSPRAFGKIMGRATSSGSMPKMYVHGQAFDGYGGIDSGQYSYSEYNYVTYTGNGKVITDANGDTVDENSPSDEEVTPSEDSETPPPVSNNNTSQNANTNNVYIRNLSIYENGTISSGLSFVGEARSTMFKDGKFPIAIVDQAGKLIGISAALATTDWTIVGWTRFQTKIVFPLPKQTPCTVVFEENLTQAERATRKPVQVPLRVKCG